MYFDNLVLIYICDPQPPPLGHCCKGINGKLILLQESYVERLVWILALLFRRKKQFINRQINTTNFPLIFFGHKYKVI